MSTIYEVAERAGVSPATVSRVFNGISVSEEKSRLVRKAAQELAFTPNRTARSLRRQSSELIALVIPDIENPYFTAVARGVEDVAQEAGYSVVLCNTDEDHDKEARYLDIALRENMAGVILAAAGDRSDVSELVARDRHVVAVDRPPTHDEVDAVTVDGRGGARLATRALVDRGFRRIACITGPADVETALRRADGWRDVVRGAGDGLLRHSDYRVEGGRAAMTDLLALPEPPDAVFAANNLVGVGALEALAAAGALTPATGLAVFGELPYAPLAPSGVVTLALPARHLGVTAARLLLERIAGDAQPARTVVFRPELSRT